MAMLGYGEERRDPRNQQHNASPSVSLQDGFVDSCVYPRP